MVKKTSSKKTVKKVSAKKSSAKKTSSKKPALSPEVKSAIKELEKLLPELDEKGIEFLIQQAGILIHNKNAAALPAERKERENRFNERMEEWSEKQQSLMEHVAVEEGSRGNHFILVMGNYRNFFVRDEMKKVVKLFHAADDDIDAGRRLYNWFEKNRSDVLKNSSISSSSDKSLRKLYEVIISTYTTKS